MAIMCMLLYETSEVVAAVEVCGRLALIAPWNHASSEALKQAK